MGYDLTVCRLDTTDAVLKRTQIDSEIRIQVGGPHTIAK